MQIQSRKERDRILAVAEKIGELHRLVWVVMQTVPGDGVYGVAIRNSLVTLPATPSPEVSGSYAHLMMEVLRTKLPKNRSLWLEVRDTEDLANSGIEWHAYGESDFICPGCAAIGNDCICQPNVKIVEAENDSPRAEKSASAPAGHRRGRKRPERLTRRK